ncbi:uncharacterized protein C7orf50 homolog [Uranotaenia lowii]|uniref:uncharacterized protein C7orf50 homolog n=1 Tax=Uranotaenia lowii TaxID=190385 RepID=UPI002479C411|nr:uncharacterized protein C7orf50 homolog [Uranotaenia lowii]
MEKRKATPEEEIPSEVPKKKSKKPSHDITAGTTLEQALLVNPKLAPKKSKKKKKPKQKEQKSEESRKSQQQSEMQQYLERWSTQRDQWKFQKRIQELLLKRVFDESWVGAELWPVLLEYLAGMQSTNRREMLSSQARDVIREIDEKSKESGDETLQQTSRYVRARDLMQHLG